MFELFVVLALSSPPGPNPPVRLSELLEEARRRNPAIAAAREQARGEAAAVGAAGAVDDPMVMVQLWNMPVDLSTVPLMVNLTQTIPLGGKRAARREEAEALAQASRAAVTTRARDVEDEVARAYFDLYLADRTIDVDGEIARTLGTLVAAASARIAAGRGEEAEALRAESEQLKVESDREAARGRRAAAVAKLVALLDRPPGSDLGRTEDPGLLAELPAPEELRARALRERPEILSADAATGAAVARLRLSHAERIPDLTASAGEMHMFGGTTSPSDFLFLGVQVNLPIFGGKSGARIAGAEAGLAASRADKRALENRVFAEVADALAEVQAETRQAQLHHKLIPLARQALQSALASYSAGRGAFSMVLDAERDLEMHELDLATHVAAYSQRLADLERAVGGEVGLVRAAASGADLHLDHEEPSR
ncbi:MAG TPA: TolC family protein [Polyangia bacterium]|jgi:cobalt-zinc-cadmium efflux system outer membrane protein